MYISKVLLFILVLFITGCSGCSESSIRRAISENPAEQDQKNRAESDNSIRQEQEVLNPGMSTNEVSRDIESQTGSTLSELYAEYKRAVFAVYTSRDDETFQGTGFFVNSSGLAVSNYHVFEGTTVGREVIETYDGTYFTVEEMLEASKDHDYMIFKVNGIHNTNFIPLAEQSSIIGENVFAISNPRGLNHTLSTGIISGYRSNNSIIQTTAEITYGSSGGALLNMNGEVVGITTSGFGEANINFAINIHELQLRRFLNNESFPNNRNTHK